MKIARSSALLFLIFLSACGQASEDPLAGPVERSGDAIIEPLNGKQGDPVRGEQIFTSREEGHCVLCHQVARLDAEFQGNVGPVLTGIGARLSAGQIRYRIVDAQGIWPDTVMPSYYRTRGLRQVGHEYQGAPALSAQQIEDIVAFLELQTN